MKKLLLALSMVAAMLASAYAQTRPVITQDRDQEGRNVFYAQASCNTVTFDFCRVGFSAVPAGKRLIITYVSIFHSMPAANTILNINLRTNTGSIMAFLKPQPYPGSNGAFNYVVSEPIFAAFSAGTSPQLITVVNSSANFSMIGIISGYYVDIP